MGQQEEPENGGVGDLVVKGLTVKVEEGWVDTDVVSKGETGLESGGIRARAGLGVKRLSSASSVLRRGLSGPTFLWE